ncbi:hypothetical protein ACH5BF_07000 [Arcobacter sp. YIC-464]|uniref:hypothetical protein n=1 Tax=Arcobacter sp. YIC-464 TaxID=3376631 RepID=UPI003C2009AF
MIKVTHEEHSLILEAQRARELNDIIALSKSNYSNVRRCIAKNRNTPSYIINSLAYDPVANVSYAALTNPICSEKRNLSRFQERCVLCPKNEAEYKTACGFCS